MIDWLIALILAFKLNITVEVGHAAYYDDGIMEGVIYVRQNCDTWGDLDAEIPPVIGYVAVNDCAELGGLVWLWHEAALSTALPELAGPYWVVDCRAEQDVTAAERKNIVVEVDYNTARRWGVVGFGPSFINVAVIRVKKKREE